MYGIYWQTLSRLNCAMSCTYGVCSFKDNFASQESLSMNYILSLTIYVTNTNAARNLGTEKVLKRGQNDNKSGHADSSMLAIIQDQLYQVLVMGFDEG